MSHCVDNEQNSAFAITEWPCCGIQGHSTSGTAPLLSRSERTHQGCKISSTRTHSPRYKQLTSHLSRFYYNWVPLATSLVTNELRANFHELSSSLWDNTLKEETLKRSFKNWFDISNMYFKFYFGFFVSSLFPKSVPGVLESAPHPLKSHDLVRFHRLRYRRISSLFCWLLCYEHTERQRQGPLESIVTHQNRPPPHFPSVRGSVILSLPLLLGLFTPLGPVYTYRHRVCVHQVYIMWMVTHHIWESGFCMQSAHQMAHFHWHNVKLWRWWYV